MFDANISTHETEQTMLNTSNPCKKANTQENNIETPPAIENAFGFLNLQKAIDMATPKIMPKSTPNTLDEDVICTKNAKTMPPSITKKPLNLTN